MTKRKAGEKLNKSTRIKKVLRPKKTAAKKPINEIDEKEEQKHINSEYSRRVENDKKLIMWSGVIFFMVLTLFFWVINLDKIFQTNKNENTGQEFNWDEISADFTNKLGDFKNDLDEIRNSSDDLLETSSDSAATSTSENIENLGLPSSISQEERLELIKTIEELEKDFEISN